MFKRETGKTLWGFYYFFFVSEVMSEKKSSIVTFDIGKMTRVLINGSDDESKQIKKKNVFFSLSVLIDKICLI